MAELHSSVFIKEEESDNETSSIIEREFVEGYIKKEEPISDELIICDNGSVKQEEFEEEEEEETYDEREHTEMISVMINEDGGVNEHNFVNEGEINLHENVPKVQKGKPKGPRKRKQSEPAEDVDWRPPSESLSPRGKRKTFNDRRHSQRIATSSHSLDVPEGSGIRDNQQVFGVAHARPIPQTFRDTEEEAEYDNLLHCDDCAADYEGDCPEHGPYHIVEDISIPLDISDKSRATRTAPPQVRVGDSKIPGAGCGVRAKDVIPPRTRFGPYEGNFVPLEECTSYSWLIRRNGKPHHCIDATELGLSNWMRFVNCARHESERNLVAFQFEGKIYYRTVCQVDPDDELLVWCGKEYGRQLGIHLDSCDAVAAKNMKDTDKKPAEATDQIDETGTSSVFISKTEIEVDFIDENEMATISTPDESPFVCNQCNECCFDEETLTSHLLTHAGENPFVCNLCNERFFDRKTLTNHQKAHGERASSYVCSDCSQVFALKEDYVRHGRTHNREKPFICLKCNIRFALSKELKGHLQFHEGEKPFGCDQCNKRFHLRHQLQKHLSAHSHEQPPFYCVSCNKQFSQKFNLQQHILARPVCSRSNFTCGWCNFVCFEEGDLHAHVILEHNGFKPYECLSCHQRFLDKGALSRHERTHEGDKPFHCNDCDKRFLRRKDLDNHLRTHRLKNLVCTREPP